MSTPRRRLVERIAEKGPIPFAALMEEALYGAEGYYARQEWPVGEQGDYVTGSSLSPLFGRATARLVRRLDGILEAAAEVLEVGYGSGAHLRGLLSGLEGAAGRRITAHDRIARPLPDSVDILESLELLPERSVGGLVFSYELFDSLPIHRLLGRPDGSVGELWVALSEEGDFEYQEGDLSDPGLPALLGWGTTLRPGQIADVAPGWRPLYRQLAARLGRGLLVTCDYGFERQRLFDPRVRFHGTLACYRSHRAHRDALRSVGEQDLTAHVDFTALRLEGEAMGLETFALTRQARWLLACGLFDDLRQADQAARLEGMRLLDADGMGEEIRVLVQTRGIDARRLLDPQLLGV